MYCVGKGVPHFPETGTKQNFEVFEPLDFLAEVTQHIPKHGQHAAVSMTQPPAETELSAETETERFK